MEYRIIGTCGLMCQCSRITQVSCSTGVTPHYAMFEQEATLPVDWVFPTPSEEKRTMYQWTGDMLEKKNCLQEHERCARWKSRGEGPDVQTFYPEHSSRLSMVWYFNPRIIPGTSHKLRLFWAGPYQVSRLI